METIDIVIIAITASSTFTLVCVTWYYAHFTQKILKASTNTPNVIIFDEADPSNQTGVFICMENIGTGTAYNININTDDSFKLDGEAPLGEVGFIKNGVKTLAQGKRVLCWMSILDIYQDSNTHPLNFHITYEDSDRKDYSGHFIISRDEILQSGRGRYPLSSIAKDISKIQKSSEEIVRHIRMTENTNRGPRPA